MQTLHDVAGQPATKTPLPAFMASMDPFAKLDQPLLCPEDQEQLAAALLLMETCIGQFRKDFKPWLANNWIIWRCFEEKANDVWSRGRTHYSARTLVEVVRHETFLREAGSEDAGGYKINNSFVPDIGRLYCLLYPMRPGFFETRTMRGECARRQIRS